MIFKEKSWGFTKPENFFQVPWNFAAMPKSHYCEWRLMVLSPCCHHHLSFG